nr:trimethylamine methyltransferase [Ipomoea batatas]
MSELARSSLLIAYCLAPRIPPYSKCTDSHLALIKLYSKDLASNSIDLSDPWLAVRDFHSVTSSTEVSSNSRISNRRSAGFVEWIFDHDRLLFIALRVKCEIGIEELRIKGCLSETIYLVRSIKSFSTVSSLGVYGILLAGEVRIRSVRILIGLGFTWFTCYWFPEELISPLAKPLLTLPLDSYFVRTQSTEAFPTYVATSPIACSYFVFPLISHQIWCFLIPSFYGEQRTKYNRFLHLSGSRFFLFLFLTPPRVVPNVWHFPYFMGATSTNSLMIKLQPKIYDHIMLTVRISFIPSVCSQVPVIVIRLSEPRGLSVETSTNNRRFLMVFPLLTAALSTPPDIWCQIVARFLISLIIEFAIFVASIVQVREEGWTSGMRESGSIDKK